MKFSQVLLLCCLFPIFTQAQLRIGLESGFTFTQYNDVRVPNGEQQKGTLFSLADDFEADQPSSFIRFELAYLIKEKHTIELTAAPLRLDYQNATLDSINFAGTTFSGLGINGRYQFDTYRLSYRYRLVSKPKVTFDLGASLLVRNAKISLSQNGLEADDDDLGFVPLISFELNYAPYDKISFLLKGDALVGPQGRAEDIFAGALFNIKGDRLKVKAGYRLIEGGADVNQVYNFAYVHFISVGLVFNI